MRLLLVAWVCVLVGCTAPREREGVTETGNPELTAGVTLRARSSDPDTISVRGNGDADVDVSRLWMAVSEVQLRQRRACDAEAPTFVPAFVTDATAPVPEVQEGTAERTVYCAARVALDPAGDATELPPEVHGSSLVVEGTSAEGRPFRVRTPRPFAIPLSKDEGNFFVDEDRDRLVVGIDVSVWLDSIWVDDGVPDADGTIRIEPGSNEDLLADFEDALLDAMDLDLE